MPNQASVITSGEMTSTGNTVMTTARASSRTPMVATLGTGLAGADAGWLTMLLLMALPYLAGAVVSAVAALPGRDASRMDALPRLARSRR